MEPKEVKERKKKETHQDCVMTYRLDPATKEVIEQFAKEKGVSVSTANRMLIAHGINYYYFIEGGK